MTSNLKKNSRPPSSRIGGVSGNVANYSSVKGSTLVPKTNDMYYTSGIVRVAPVTLTNVLLCSVNFTIWRCEVNH